MKAITRVLFLVLTLVLLSSAAFIFAAEIPDEHLVDVSKTEDEEISILCLGNSILAHGPSEAIGWFGNHGMAASSIDKDYYHVLQKLVSDAGYANINWNRSGITSIERAIDSRAFYDYKTEILNYFAPEFKLVDPDVVVFQMGENVAASATVASYSNVLTRLYEYCKSVKPEVEIIFCTPFWGGDAKVSGVKLAAVETKSTFADLSVLNTDENKAIGLFEHGGVAAHPGDKGMSNIADIIFEQLNPILKKMTDQEDTLSFKLDGQYITYDVDAKIIDGVCMIPLRAFAEAINSTVNWDGNERKVSIITAPGDKIEFVLGNTEYKKNGTEILFEVPAKEVSWRTLVPLSMIKEAFDCKASYDKTSKTVYLNKPSNTSLVPEAILLDTCDKIETSNFFSDSCDVSVSNLDIDTNKFIKVSANTNSDISSNVWTRIDLVPGKSYEMTAEVYTFENAATIEFVFRHDGKNVVAVSKDISEKSGWKRVSTVYTVPEDMLPNYGADRVAVIVKTKDGKNIDFAIDNVTVKPVTVIEKKTEKIKLDSDLFIKGNGFAVDGLGNNLSDSDKTVTVKNSSKGVIVSHGGYYTNGNDWGGVALKDAYTLDGMTVTVNFDKVPVVDKSGDCWIAFCFLNKPELFKVGNIPGNKGFMNLTRFNSNLWEVYEGVTKFARIAEIRSNTDMFKIKSGDVVTIGAKLVDGNYEFTLKNGENSQTVRHPVETFADVFPEGKAYFVIGASCKGTTDAFKYTITNIEYVK